MPGSDLSRKLIRDNVKSILLNNTDAGDNIFISRVNKAFLEELPGIFIYTLTDVPLITRRHDQNYNRRVNLVIEVITAETDKGQAIQDELDVIVGQVEDLLLMNPFLQYPEPWQENPGEAIVNYIQQGEISLARTDEIKEDTIGAVIEYEVEYYYTRATVGNLEDFKRFQAKYLIDDMTADRLVEIPES